MRHVWAGLVVAACSSQATPTTAPVVVVTPKDAPTKPLVAKELGADCAEDRLKPPDYDGEVFGSEERVATSKNACAVADSNLARLEKAIKAGVGAGPAMRAWDHKAKPKYLDAITQRFDLRGDELARIGKLGFAVESRLSMESYTTAYHEIFQSELPVYITADSIFHAIFASHDSVVKELETERLAPILEQTLTDMHCALGAAAANYPADTARDLDLYLLVGRELLSPQADLHSAFGDGAVEAEAKSLVEKIAAAASLDEVVLFGRPRSIDFTAYQPRGHYTGELEDYFHAAMWTSRLEFNLVSRSSRSSALGEPDPRETPREALDALALADLADRAPHAVEHIAEMDRAWQVLAGKREDVSIAQLDELRKQVGVLTAPDAFAKLKTAIGDRFQRTTRIHPMAEGSKVLPAIATMIGPRIVPDATALMPVVNSAVPSRDWATASDVAYALGFDHAKAFLQKDLATFPALDAQLEKSRATIKAMPAGDDLYSAWLMALRGLAAPVQGGPSFLATDAALDMRQDTIVTAYGQLKHDYVLIAGQPYAEFGCQIPDAYVEPVPAAFDALIEYARRGEQAAMLLESFRKQHKAVEHFRRTGEILKILRAIVDDELANRPLSADEKHWLGMVAELDINLGVDTTGHPPTYTGWYFDLFFSREEDGMRNSSFVADYFTGQQGVAYVGADEARMGVFVVDAGGEPRAFVGPVAHGWEAQGAIGERFTNEKPPATKSEPWSASYAVASTTKVPESLQAEYTPYEEQPELVITSASALGKATIKMLDHHRRPLKTVTATVGIGQTRLKVPKKTGAIYLEVGGVRDTIVPDGNGRYYGSWGKPPPEQP